jgi:uncharacterized delta-60 repeat protein
MVTVRLNDNGLRDASFGQLGVTETNFRFGDHQAFAVNWTATGILLTGVSTNGPAFAEQGDFAFAKLSGNGSPVPAFDGDGRRIVTWNWDTATGVAVAVQPDGKIVIAGLVGSSALVVRLNPNGSPDLTFGNLGAVSIPVAGGMTTSGVALQTDGKILICGNTGSVSSGEMIVVRLNPGGTVDTSFNSTGIKLINFGPGGDEAAGIAIDSFNRIVVVGTANVSTNAFDLAIVRLLPDGSDDSSFDSDGRATLNTGSDFETLRAVRIQPDGRIVAAGYRFTDFTAFDDFVVTRFNENGSPDLTFNSIGWTRTPVGTSTDLARTLSLQSDGKIVVAGETTVPGFPNRIAVVRYLTSGALDPSFGSGGIVTTQIGTGSNGAFFSEIQTDGRIFVGGYTTINGRRAFTVIRYATDGTLSLADQLGALWGNNGVAVIDVTPGDDTIIGFRFDPNGNLVAVGSAGGNIGVIRLQGFAPTAASVSVSGRVTTADGRGISNAIVWLQTSDGTVRQARTSSFGFYQIDQLPSGKPAVAGVTSKARVFEPRVIELTDNATNVDFIALGAPADTRRK